MGVFSFSGLDVEVVRKDIKNVHLSVLPPDGAVRISVPPRLSDQVIRSYVLSRLQWIRGQQTAFAVQPREPRREYLYRESHYAWGQRYLLELELGAPRHSVSLRPGVMTLSLWGGYTEEKCQRVLDAWYREQVKLQTDRLVPKLSKRIGATPRNVFVQRMKTRWGGCNSEFGNIRLNSELAKKPVECLEYILVHELLHLIEPTHNNRFKQLLEHHLPNWEARRALLNSLPLSHENWRY